MLVEFTRAHAARPETGEGEDDGLAAEVAATVERPRVAINPVLVGAVFADTERSNTVVVRSLEGRGLLIEGDYAETISRLAGATLVEFVRGDGNPTALNPAVIGAVFASNENPELCIVRLAGGRGFNLRGTYSEIVEQLQGGSVPAATLQ